MLLNSLQGVLWKTDFTSSHDTKCLNITFHFPKYEVRSYSFKAGRGVKIDRYQTVNICLFVPLNSTILLLLNMYIHYRFISSLMCQEIIIRWYMIVIFQCKSHTSATIFRGIFWYNFKQNMTQNMLIIQFFTSLYRASLLINMSATFHHSSADLNPDCQLGKDVFNHRQQHSNINERSFLSVPASDNDLDVSPLLLPFHSAQVVWSHGGRELSSSALVLWKQRVS